MSSNNKLIISKSLKLEIGRRHVVAMTFYHCNVRRSNVYVRFGLKAISTVRNKLRDTFIFKR